MRPIQRFRRSDASRHSEPEPGPPPVASLAVDGAEAWLRGQGDLLPAAMGRRVPLIVQLGVLAHADITRLEALGRAARHASVRRAWGTDMARLAGDVARTAGTPARLEEIQRSILVPLEL